MSFTRDTSHFDMSPLNDVAPVNMLFTVKTRDTSHFEISPLNFCAPKNMADMFFTLDTLHFEMSWLNNFAFENMLFMYLVLETSHFEMSPAKFVIANAWLISIILDTSHLPMGPCGRLGESLRHASIPVLSSELDCGENAVFTLVARAPPGAFELLNFAAFTVMTGTWWGACEVWIK